MKEGERTSTNYSVHVSRRVFVRDNSRGDRRTDDVLLGRAFRAGPNTNGHRRPPVDGGPSAKAFLSGRRAIVRRIVISDFFEIPLPPLDTRPSSSSFNKPTSHRKSDTRAAHVRFLRVLRPDDAIRPPRAINARFWFDQPDERTHTRK